MLIVAFRSGPGLNFHLRSFISYVYNEGHSTQLSLSCFFIQHSLNIDPMIYEILARPIPWYVGGLLLGLMVPILFIIGNKAFGISSSYRHVCAAVIPSKLPFFNYDWKNKGGWQLQLAIGIIIGGAIAMYFTPENYQIDITSGTTETLRSYGISNFSGYLPEELFNWNSLISIPGLSILVLGGFLIGFGTRYGSGCTAGHGITGMATFQKASLIATISFFIGGMLSAQFLIPLILK